MFLLWELGSAAHWWALLNSKGVGLVVVVVAIIDFPYISDLLSGCEGLVERDGQHLHRPRHHAGSRGHRQRVHATATVTSRRLTALVGMVVAPCGSLVALCVCVRAGSFLTGGRGSRWPDTWRWKGQSADFDFELDFFFLSALHINYQASFFLSLALSSSSSSSSPLGWQRWWLSRFTAPVSLKLCR